MIYLDNAATTKPSDEAISAVADALREFGNPSSLHKLGMLSEKIIDNSKTAIAKKLGCQKKGLYFTSGGTEANNLAIFGTAYNMQKRGKHIITSKIEHPSVLGCFKLLENEGFEVTYIDCLPSGVIDIEMLKNSLTDKTTLVSIMNVNNETGVIQPIREVSDLVHKMSPLAVVHTDCVQAFCKTDCNINNLKADLITVSSHKIHGPKGVGALYIGNNKIKPQIVGGQQQDGIRPGTENVPGIAGFGAAVKDYGSCVHLYDLLKNRIVNEIDNVKINGDEKLASKYVLNVSFIGIKAEILLHSLEAKGIYVSTGSACSSHKPEPSHILTAMGLSKKEIEGAIRFSFDTSISEDDINYTVDVLKDCVAEIRKYVR